MRACGIAIPYHQPQARRAWPYTYIDHRPTTPTPPDHSYQNQPRPPPPAQVYASLLPVVLGVSVACAHDVSFSWPAFITAMVRRCLHISWP